MTLSHVPKGGTHVGHEGRAVEVEDTVAAGVINPVTVTTNVLLSGRTKPG